MNQLVSHETASSSAKCSRDKPPFSVVRGQDSTVWDIVWVSPQGHRSVSVSRHFLLQAPQSLFCVKTVQQGPLLLREVETRLPDCRVTHYVRIDHTITDIIHQYTLYSCGTATQDWPAEASCSCPSVHSSVTGLVNMVFSDRMNQFWCELAHVVHRVRIQQLTGLTGLSIGPAYVKPVSFWTAFIVMQQNGMAATVDRRYTTYLSTDSVLPVLPNILLAN